MVVPSLRDDVQPPHRARLPVLHLLGQADVCGQWSRPDPVPGNSHCSLETIMTNTDAGNGVIFEETQILQFYSYVPIRSLDVLVLKLVLDEYISVITCLLADLRDLYY